MRVRLACIMMVLGLCAAATGARAQSTRLPTLDLEHLQPSAAAVGSLVVEAGELLPSGGWRVSLAGDYERELLIVERNGMEQVAALSDRFTLHFAGAYAPAYWLELVAQLPILPAQSGDNLMPIGFATPASAGVGTPTLGARVALVRKQPFDLSLGVRVGFPVGNANALARESGVSVAPSLSASRRFLMLMASASVGVLVRPSAQFSDGRELGDQLDVGAALATTAGGLRVEVSGRAIQPFTDAPAAFEVLAGMRLAVAPGVELYALAGPGIGDGPGTPQLRALFGLAVTAETSSCLPGRAHAPAECPDLDDDHDGVRNGADKCPALAGDPANAGCPILDRDKDGVPDICDKCPDQPGPAATQGCPAPAPPKDRDGDGVPDDADQCPDQPGPASEKGCPIKDRDKDGIIDSLDNCPDQPGPPANQGCPVGHKQLVVITPDRIEIRERVLFATGRARILPGSFNLLDQVAAVIIDHPEITHILVEGHTDIQGGRNRNIRLSQARADAVRDYLVDKGLPPEMLETKGFGPDRPTDTNSTAAGREKNRRVEFKIVSTTPAARP